MKFSLRSYAIRLGIVGFWVTAIFIFLFSPVALKLFSEKKES